MPARITMRDIAERAGVSVMTVSFALRGSRQVSAGTCRRIQALADEMGFRPDPGLRSLVAYRGRARPKGELGTIAYLNCHDAPSVAKRIPLHRALFNGAREKAGALGFKVEEFWLGEPGLTPGRASKILVSRGIQGLLVAPQPAPHARLDLEWDRFAVLQFGFSLQTPRFHAVINDQFHSGATCMRELCRLGYRSIGLVIGSAQDERTENRFMGAYLSLQQKLPRALPRLPVLMGDDLSEDAFRAWFARHRPDAIMGPVTDILPWIRKMSVRIPEDLGYALSFRFTQGALRFAYSDGRYETTGATAVEYLSRMISHHEFGVPEVPMSLLAPASWQIGNTVRKVGPPVLFTGEDTDPGNAGP